MSKKHLVSLIAAGFLTIGAPQPAGALDLDLDLGVVDLSIGGGESDDADGGTVVSTSVAGGAVSAGVGVGGTGSGLSAGVETSVGESRGGARVLLGNGRYLTLEADGDVVLRGPGVGIGGVQLDLDADIDLDGPLGGVRLGLAGVEASVDLFGDPPSDPGVGDDGFGLYRDDGQWFGPAEVARLFAQFSPGEQELLVSRCLTILTAPPNYERNLVDLCLMLAQLNAPMIR